MKFYSVFQCSLLNLAGDLSVSKSRTAKRQSNRWVKTLWVLPVVAVGGFLYGAWPNASLTASSSALARLNTNGTLKSAVAVGPQSQKIKLMDKHGQLWPLSSMTAGTRYQVHLVIAGPSWWPFGSRTLSQSITTPKDPMVRATDLTVSPNTPVSLSLSSPASSLHIISQHHHAVIRSSVPQDTYSIHSLGTAPGEQGTLTVQTQARAWESVSTPKTLSWRTPGWLKVQPSPSTSAAIGLTQPLTLHFSHAVANTNLQPTLTPNIKGQWVWKNSTTEEFVPSSSSPWGWGPNQVIKVVVPGGPHGYHSPTGAYLTKNNTVSWATSSGSTLRLQELLAKLGYLPLTWTPDSPVSATLSAQVGAMMKAPTGKFQWRYPNTPPPLQALWTPGQYTVMVKGAVMNFERVHNLPVDGIAGPAVWKALIQADLANQMNPDGYSYVYVSETLPETLTLWHNGQVILRSPTNTGIPQSPTYLGTHAVYVRYLSQTMKGVNPNGVPYNDPGVPYVNYFDGGDAVHGFPRAKYGFPQSLGCVELPIPEAAKVWPYLHYGSLVTVDPPGSPSTYPTSVPSSALTSTAPFQQFAYDS